MMLQNKSYQAYSVYSIGIESPTALENKILYNLLDPESIDYVPQRGSYRYHEVPDFYRGRQYRYSESSGLFYQTLNLLPCNEKIQELLEFQSILEESFGSK